MKHIIEKTIITTMILSTSLFANYAYTGENSGKIDMHGGKGESLLSNKNKFSNTGISPLSNIGIQKPTSPIKPIELIKKEKKKTEEKTDLKPTE